MPDISMCKGTDCSLKYHCYRFTAIPSMYRQAYFVKPPFRDTIPTGGKYRIETKCDYHVNTRAGKDI